MKKSLFFLLLFITSIAFAQKGLDEMIAAEKSFAAYSVAHSTKEAFLQFIDTGAVMFNKGEPVNGYQLWMKKEKNAGILRWRPRFAEIAASGDFGYTCGPWTFQPNANDTIVASGYFFTVWKKRVDGAWKFLLDVGTDTGPMMNETDVTKVVKEKRKKYPHDFSGAEKKFISIYKTDTAKAYTDFLSDKTILAKEKTGLSAGMNTWKPISGPVSGTLEFTVQGSGIAPSGDLGYVYGSAVLNGNKETYLRIWRQELTGWKIALQLIRF